MLPEAYKPLMILPILFYSVQDLKVVLNMRDVQKLKLVLATMSKEEAEKHLTRCCKSGILTAKLHINSQQEKHMDPGQSDAAVNDRF
jgi:hypothetical protein